jgi:hypothetical protein
MTKKGQSKKIKALATAFDIYHPFDIPSSLGISDFVIPP